MPWSQFYHWQQFMEVCPFGERRNDLRTGYAFATLASVIIASQGGKHQMKPSDFIPDWDGTVVSGNDIHPITKEEWQLWKESIKSPLVNR